MTLIGALMWLLIAVGVGVIWWKRPDIPLGSNKKSISYAKTPWRWRLTMLALSGLSCALAVLDALRS